MKVAWTIAASDSSSGAGIQADLATFAHFKVHGCSIITKVTAQNTKEITHSYELSDKIFNQQINALNVDLKAHAIKISVLGNMQLNKLVDFLKTYSGYLVYDPIFLSSSNTILTNLQLIEAICQKLLPHITLITPNIQEVELLTNIKIKNYKDIIKAAKKILQLGVQNVLIKGGHFISEYASDFFINTQQSFWLVSKRQVFSTDIHGTGCRLSSAIAANLALGNNITEAVIIAKRYLNSALRVCNLPVIQAKQHYIPQFSFNYNHKDMPIIVNDYSKINKIFSLKFIACESIGLYPIVDSSIWVASLANTGIKTIQLRIKNGNIKYIEEEIIKSIEIANSYKIKIFINDYWDLAIKHKAYGVHLGQEDLLLADIQKINIAGLRLGLSTHNYYELALAIGLQPSYIALGPIFPTKSKVMPFLAQGLNKLMEWQQMLDNKCQLVAIGGININNIKEIINLGIKNIALISAITNAKNPLFMTKILLKKLNNYE